MITVYCHGKRNSDSFFEIYACYWIIYWQTIGKNGNNFELVMECRIVGKVYLYTWHREMRQFQIKVTANCVLVPTSCTII